MLRHEQIIAGLRDWIELEKLDYRRVSKFR